MVSGSPVLKKKNLRWYYGRAYTGCPIIFTFLEWRGQVMESMLVTSNQ